jgi:DNA-binding Lrp family transcriptional regulator
MATEEDAPAREVRTHPIDGALLENWQRHLPLIPRPFAEMADQLGVSEDLVLARLTALQQSGIVARVGAVVRPNTLGASTLAAVAARTLDVDAVAERLAGMAGINHVYLRENALNIWFVVTGPDRAYVDATLQAVERQTRLTPLDLRLEEAFHIDLGFPLERHGEPLKHAPVARACASARACDELDRALAQSLTDGLPLVAQPFAAIGRQLALTEAEVIARLEALRDAVILPRIGVIVRHRALGWRSNAMVVFDVEPGKVSAAGQALARVPGINLCYRRTRYADAWPYNLYCMVHARSRSDAFATLADARRAADLDDVPMQVLFSQRCYKQTGALIKPREAA